MNSRIVRVSLVVMLSLSMALLFASGCRSAEENGEAEEPAAPATPTPEPTVPPEPADLTQVLVYFAKGEKLGVVGRELTEVSTAYEAALKALLEGPTADEVSWGMHSEIPQGTQLLGVEIGDDRVATVDLTAEFGSGGGSLSMQVRVAQVVYTLTQFEGVDTVAFMIDGEPAEAIGGEGLIVSPPVGRDDFANVVPEILIEHPVPGQSVTSPIPVSGQANTFEATFQLELSTAEGVIAERLVTGGGSGTWEPFSTDLEFSRTEPIAGYLNAYYFSAEDGSRVDAYSVPVTLEP